jgi:hypothetical protein
MSETEKTARLEGMEDRLERVLNRVIDWIKYEEAKNAALITLDGVGGGVILQWLNVSQGKMVMVLSPWLKGSLAALLISLLVALSGFYPVIKGKRLHRYFARRRPHPTEYTGQRSNILFFGDIAGAEPEAYLKDLHAAVGAPAEIELAYAREIVTNAEIALMKLRVFEAAFVVSFLGFIVACAAAVAYIFGR